MRQSLVSSTKYSFAHKGYCNSVSGKRTFVSALNKGLSISKVYSLRGSAVKDKEI